MVSIFGGSHFLDHGVVPFGQYNNITLKVNDVGPYQ